MSSRNVQPSSRLSYLFGAKRVSRCTKGAGRPTGYAWAGQTRERYRTAAPGVNGPVGASAHALDSPRMRENGPAEARRGGPGILDVAVGAATFCAATFWDTSFHVVPSLT